MLTKKDHLNWIVEADGDGEAKVIGIRHGSIVRVRFLLTGLEAEYDMDDVVWLRDPNGK